MRELTAQQKLDRSMEARKLAKPGDMITYVNRKAVVKTGVVWKYTADGGWLVYPSGSENVDDVPVTNLVTVDLKATKTDMARVIVQAMYMMARLPGKDHREVKRLSGWKKDDLVYQYKLAGVCLAQQAAA